MNDFDKITPLQRALLESVSIPDLAVGGLPQIKLLQSNSQDLLNSPDNPWYLEGAMAGGFAAPGREGRVFIPVPPGFHSGAFAFVQEWIEGELDAEGEFQQIGEPHAVKPIDAIWRKDPITGKKVFKRDNGHLMREHINCLMKVEETGQIGRYVFAKTALRIGREFANASQRLKVEGLGVDHTAMVVKEVSYEVTDPTVDSQVVTLQGAGADTLVIAATSKAAAQTIRKAYDIGWRPVRYLNYPGRSIAATLKPAGLDKSTGLIGGVFVKDPTDARWKDDPGFKEYAAFIAKYMSPAEFIDFNAVSGFCAAAMLIQVLKQCGDDLSRENIMRQAADLKDVELPMLLPGIKVNTSPDNHYPIRQMQLASFNGESWVQFGDILSG